MIWIPTLGFLTMVTAGPAATKDVNAQVYKDQFCTDPRTMRKHAAYTEWADAYSCSRHRCQPGGRNLAIYTVGCKRVEAPESAIECEEVVEDTNMQFPFCCMRLRCLVVVRGEVWTRVLGQPWEVLPAAPWSHMYKMKKPPPADTAFQPKANEQGPVYELSDPTSETEHEKVPRSGRKQTPSDSTDCNEVMPRALPASAPDIVIALSTNNEKEFNAKNQDVSREEEKVHHEPDPQDLEETAVVTEKPPEHDASDEKFFGARFGLKEKQPNKVSPQQFGWTDIPPSQWNDHEHDHEHEHEHEHEGIENRGNNVMELRYTQEPRSPGFSPVEPVERAEEKAPKSNNLQALVDAIGTRMRDIENVVQRMSEKVHHSKTTQEASIEKNRIPAEVNFVKHHKPEVKETKPKTEVELEHSSDDERYKQRFSIRGRNNKILHSSSPETTSEQPLFIEDNTNYFSDASNAVRRAQLQPKQEPHTMYMAPVENHHKAPPQINLVPDTSAPEEVERKKKKHSHKKKKNKSHVHKKHHNVDKRKHFNKLSSVEIDKNAVSMEDSSIILSN